MTLARPLEFDALIKPIPPESRAAPGALVDIWQKLEEGRREESDPQQPEDVKKADWPSVVKLAEGSLRERSKDLRIAARLTEALTKLHGFAGVRDGLHLLRLLIEQCWEGLDPPLEDGDLEIRAGPFNWLDDPDRGARFPNTVRLVPWVGEENGGFGWYHWRQAQEGKGPLSLEDFEKAIQATSAERCQAVAAMISESLAELNQLTQLLNTRMGPAAPGMLTLRQALEDCQRLTQQVLQRKRPDLAPSADITKEPSASGSVSTPQPVASRAEAYRRLAEAAALLQTLEPHSPIPYLVQRAVELGALPFPQLIKELVRDANVLAALNRELGIKEPKEAPAKK